MGSPNAKDRDLKVNEIDSIDGKRVRVERTFDGRMIHRNPDTDEIVIVYQKDGTVAHPVKKQNVTLGTEEDRRKRRKQNNHNSDFMRLRKLCGFLNAQPHNGGHKSRPGTMSSHSRSGWTE